MLQAADSLEHLHRLTAVHRDIKPANLLFSASGTVKSADFGIARVCEDSLLSTTITGMSGTVAYMPPGTRYWCITYEVTSAFRSLPSFPQHEQCACVRVQHTDNLQSRQMMNLF
jgi:hypothetical protein